MRPVIVPERPATPLFWSGQLVGEWYTALESTVAAAGSEPGAALYVVDIRASVARLTVTSQDLSALSLTINGTAYDLSTHVGKGQNRMELNLSPVLRYGQNPIAVRVTGPPGAAARLKVEVPVFSAHLIQMADLHGQVGGLPQIATYLQQVRAENTNVFVVNLGDTFGDSTTEGAQEAGRMVWAFNAMGLELMVPGNHEFDFELPVLGAIWKASAFPWVAANAFAIPGVPEEFRFQPYRIVSNHLGQRIAFVGVTSLEAAHGGPASGACQFTDPLEAAQQTISAIQDEANIVVVVSHTGLEVDRELAARLSGAHLILGGHSHTSLEVPVEVQGKRIMHVGAYGRYIGDLVVRQAQGIEVSGGAADGAWLVPVAALADPDPEIKRLLDDRTVPAP